MEFDLMNYGFDSWERVPVARASLDEDDEIYECLKLQEKKGIELGKENEKDKGRICVVGCTPRDKHGRQMLSAPHSTYSSVASLEAVKVCWANAAVRESGALQEEGGFPPQKTDFTNFYLGSECPRKGKVWLDLRALVPLMSETERQLHVSVENPVYLCVKAIYGLDDSGRAAILDLRERIKKGLGLTQTTACASLYRDDHDDGSVSFLVAYSDDTNRSGSQVNRAKLVSVMGVHYGVKVEPADQMIGFRHAGRSFDPPFVLYKMAHVGHLSKVISDYEVANKVIVPVSDRAITLDVMRESFEGIVCYDIPAASHTAVAALMWRYRCDRDELGYPLSSLSSFVSPGKWNDILEEQLRSCLGYCKGTLYDGLIFRVHPKCVWENLKHVVYVDASLQFPRSQGGYVHILTDSWGSILPIAWRSWKQPLACVAVKDCEYVACHTAVDDQLNWVKSTGVRDHTLYVLCDNRGVVDDLAGDGEGEGYLARALGLRKANLKEMIQVGQLRVGWVRSESNLSDEKTKLDKARFGFHRPLSSLGVSDSEAIQLRFDLSSYMAAFEVAGAAGLVDVRACCAFGD